MTVPLPSFVIPRHCVAAGREGLSPLQETLIHHSARVRIASAPTGAGKSYAFQRAVEKGKRVLFAVPTRRLAQNLAASLIEALTPPGADPAIAASRVALWTSDERSKQLAENPELKVGRLRIRQLRGLEARREGDIIIATPESVVRLLMRPAYAGLGEAPVGIHDPIREFDHIVFDEFHCIDARGFGLAAAIAKVAASVTGEHGVRVTFLSATPIDIKTPLVAFGIPSDAIEQLEETVLTGSQDETGTARALHGDVAISFHDAQSMADLAEAQEPEIRACLGRGRQVVIVCDALRDLLPAKARLAAFFDRIGVPYERRLAINSADDGSTGGHGDNLFCGGREADPMQFDVLLATSSVEMGVTFRAGLILMDPGLDTLSFVQRIGRVARGNEPGQVFVRAPESACNSRDWLRRLIGALQQATTADGRLAIQDFTALAMRSTAERFAMSDAFESADAVPTTFRSMPMRAVWCAALFWAVLERAERGTTGMRRTLESFRPRQVNTVLHLLSRLRACGLRSAKKWGEAFEAEALRLRMIPQRVLIREPSGRTRPLSWNIYAAYAALVAAPAVLDDKDELIVLIDSTLEDILATSDRRWVEARVETSFPHGGGVEYIEGRDMAGAWLNKAAQHLRSARLPEQRVALEAAIELVRLSRIIPMASDQVQPADGSNVVS